MNKALQQQALDKLVATCPMCNAPRQLLTTSIVNQTQAADLLHIRCGSCQGSLVAVVYSTGPLISSIGLITDLSGDDVARLQRSAALTEDDVLTLHQHLQQVTFCKQLVGNAQ
ncbi:MAG: hypothetical protein HYV33_00485 [Candidatus Kerfeldbacteria bacterium]|nr:hypothetical protein [Candidatus Kerfeldbacteria bacterium]